ncbi:reverse transcriptase domain-containing protein [Tanacetum coccineum]
MDDEPMWAAERVVAPTPGSAITIPETANEFSIKDTKNEAARLMMFPLSLTGEAKTWLDKLNERTIKTWDELRTDFISRFFPPALFDRLLGEIHAFSQHENECLTDAWLRMKEMLRNFHGHNMSKGNIIKIFYHGLNEITQKVLNATAGGIFLYKTPNQAYQLLEDSLTQARLGKIKKPNHLLRKLLLSPLKYKELQSHAKQPTPDLDDDDIPMSREEDAKFMQTFHNYQSNIDDKSYDLQIQFNDFMKSQQSTNAFVKETFMDLKTRLETVAKNHQASIQNLKTKFDRLADKQSSRPSGSLPSNTQPNPRGNNSTAYQPSQSRNEYVNAVFTRSSKSYDLPDNPNDQQNNSETPINFDSDDEDAENILVDVGKFIFRADFVILKMEEDSSSHFEATIFHTADAVIRVKQKQLNLRVETE